MPRISLWAVALLSLFLAGCSQLEQRADLPEKKPLIAIEAPIKINRKWIKDTGAGTDHKDIKLLLAAEGINLYTADANGTLMAINRTSGATVWTTALKAKVSAGPAIGDGKLVVGTNDGRVIAVDINNGKIVWLSRSTSEILAAPYITNDMVLIHTMDGGLSALSLLDGRQLWRYTHNLPPLMLRRSSTPVVRGDVIIAGFANGKLLAMRKNDGSIIWVQDVSQPKGSTDLQRMIDISADPVIVGNRVYAASYQGNIAAIDFDTGNVIWERSLPSFSGLVVDQEFIYESGTNGDVVAIDANNGVTYWLQNELQGRLLSKPALMGKYLIVADNDGNVHWLEKATGKLVGRFELDKGGIEATPIVIGKIVYILGCGGSLVALEID